MAKQSLANTSEQSDYQDNMDYGIPTAQFPPRLPSFNETFYKWCPNVIALCPTDETTSTTVPFYSHLSELVMYPITSASFEGKEEAVYDLQRCHLHNPIYIPLHPGQTIREPTLCQCAEGGVLRDLRIKYQQQKDLKLNYLNQQRMTISLIESTLHPGDDYKQPKFKEEEDFLCKICCKKYAKSYFKKHLKTVKHLRQV